MRPRLPDEVWERYSQGREKAATGDHKGALADFGAALELAGDPQARVAILNALGDAHEELNDPAQAEQNHRAALDLTKSAWGESLHAARSLRQLARVARLQGKLQLAADLNQPIL